MSVVQAVIFNKSFFTTRQARSWLKHHGYKPIKRVHKTKNYLRYRIREPSHIYKTITKKISNGVALVIEFK